MREFEDAVPEQSDFFRVTSDPFFLTLAETTEDCIRLLNLNGEVQFMNRRGQFLFEIDVWRRNEGRYWPGLLPDVSFRVADAAVRAALRGEVARFRAYCPTAKGTPKWWDNVVSPVRARDSDELIGLLATSHDVTAELATESFLDVVIDNVPMIVIVKDAIEGRFQLINRTAERVFGVPRQNMLGKTDQDFFPPEQVEVFRRADQHAIASGSVVDVAEEPVDTQADGTRYFRTRKVAIYGPDGPQHVVCVAEDITEQRDAAEELKLALIRAEAATQVKTEFLANMSHEIRTPLNGVVGVASVLAGTELDPRQREMIELIRDSGRTLERLLSDILDLARGEAGQLELRPEPFNLAETVRAVGDLHELRAREKDIQLVVEVAPEAERRFLGDATRIKQVLANLLSNAVKFTEAGRVGLRVEPSGAGFRLIVEDTGIGFDPALREQLFHTFHQADGSITRRFGGSGVGLAITHQLVELMGGQIECDSRPGEGSWFAVTLAFPPAGLEATAGGVPTRDPGDERPVRILLADDHATNRKVVELILEQAGFQLVAVEDGRQAVELFAEGGFDVVLMDMQMPVMDGLTATRLIRDHEALTGAARTPLIMLTANTMPDHVRAGLEAGADRYMAKPVRAPELLTAIVELLE